MKARRSVVAVLGASALVAAPSASAIDGAPLPKREGVVIAWHAPTKTAVIATSDQRVYVVHSLRRVTPGRRVRVDGVKWGTPTSGIKWGTPASGIKWGIVRATNGTFRSNLTPLSGRATTMALRGRVVKRVGTRGVVVAVPGGRVVVPFRGAVWLPGGRVTNGTSTLGQFGARVTVRISFTPKGAIFSNRVVETAPPTPLGAVPVAGKVAAVDPAARTLTIQAGNAAFPISLVITVPATADLSRYPVGSHIAASVVEALPPDTGLTAVALSLNAGFAQADAPATSIVVPPPDRAHVAAVDDLQARWVAGRTQNLIPNTGLFESQTQRLNRIEFLIVVGDKAKAIMELDQFEKRFQNAGADAIDPALRDKLIELSVSLRGQLAA